MQLTHDTKKQLHGSFVEDHWQKNSVFFSQCFTDNNDFEHHIDINELAGLALEDEIESRLISQNNPAELIFNVENGPFTDAAISQLPASHWTLLIQAVDHYLETFQALKQQFDFIPNWRLDDVMISISPTGGTVGPHFDQYDVFLIQASGTREWQVGQQCNDHSELISGNALSIIKDFQAEQTHQCSPGDMLYIPPGKSHWGTATSDNCVTISIGFRALSYLEIIDDICLEANSNLGESQRFNDTAISNTDVNPALIDQNSLNEIEQQLHAMLLNKTMIAKRINVLSSQIKYDDAFDIISQSHASEQLEQWHQAQAIIALRANCRINFSECPQSQQLMIGLNGELIELPNSEALQELIALLSSYQTISLNDYADHEACFSLLRTAISLDAIDNLEDQSSYQD